MTLRVQTYIFKLKATLYLGTSVLLFVPLAMIVIVVLKLSLNWTEFANTGISRIYCRHTFERNM
jgi:hypothetical protein